MKEIHDSHEAVTIIMPVYNPGKYLAPCMESLLAQTFRDFRIIAIDDGSTDGSGGDVLRAYAAQDARILAWRNPENLGAARTRNIGIQMARGEYLAVVDADDIYEPTYLELLLEAMEHHHADVVECDFISRDEQTGEESVACYPRVPFCDAGPVISTSIHMTYLFCIAYCNPFVHLVRRSFVSRHALQFQDISSNNDVYFARMLLFLTEKWIHIATPLVIHRRQTGNQISTNRHKHPENAIRALAHIKETLEQLHLFDGFRNAFHDGAVLGFINAEFLPAYEKFGATVLPALQRGLHDLGMSQLERSDFSSPLAYFRWRSWIQGMPPGQKNGMPETYQEFFDVLAKCGKAVALWGYGKLGKRFLQEAECCGFQVTEVYDNDASKWDAEAAPPVKGFEKREMSVEIIVVTNSRFYEDICRQIQAIAPRIRVIDFSAYCQWGYFPVAWKPQS